MYLTILWFSLNCLSFFELFTFRIIDSCSHEKTFIRLLHLFLSCAFRAFHLSVKLYHTFTCAFPFSFGKTYNLDYLSSSVRFYSNLSSIRLSKISCDLAIAATFRLLVGLDGLEPSTSRLSGARSSHLSYKPEFNS